MNDEATLTPQLFAPVEREALRVPGDFPTEQTHGWWILPIVIAGAVFWFALISLVF